MDLLAGRNDLSILDLFHNGAYLAGGHGCRRNRHLEVGRYQENFAQLPAPYVGDSSLPQSSLSCCNVSASPSHHTTHISPDLAIWSLPSHPSSGVPVWVLIPWMGYLLLIHLVLQGRGYIEQVLLETGSLHLSAVSSTWIMLPSPPSDWDLLGKSQVPITPIILGAQEQDQISPII